MLAPVLPHLTDSEEHLDAALSQIAAAGATGVTVLALHLRPGAREWFFAWLERERPDLVPAYRRLYARGSEASKDYREWLKKQARPILKRYGLGGVGMGLREVPQPSPPPQPPVREQLTLL
jgi:DNA repair photolyase